MATIPANRARSEKLAAWMPVITAIVGLAYLVTGYFAFVLPRIGPLMKGGELDLSGLELHVSDLRNADQAMEQTVKEYLAINDANKARVSQMVTYDTDLPGLLVTLEDLARRNNLILTSIDAVPVEKRVTPTGRKTLRISLVVEGGPYEQFKLYLRDVERSLRLLDIQAIAFSSGEQRYSLVAHAYYLDPPGQAAPATPKP